MFRYHDGFLEKLSNQINVLETEMPSQRVKIQKLERQSLVLLENCLFEQADVQKQIRCNIHQHFMSSFCNNKNTNLKFKYKSCFHRDLTSTFSEFEREMLQQKSKLIRFQDRIKSYRAKAQQIIQMIQTHITTASATETGLFLQTWDVSKMKTVEAA